MNPKDEPSQTSPPAVTHLHRKASYFSISQRLRYSRQPDGEACEHVHLKPLQLVPGQPGEDGQPGLQRAVGAAAPAGHPSQHRPVHRSRIRGEEGEPGEEEEDDGGKNEETAASAQR